MAEMKDPVKVAPKNFKVAFENERVRVLDIKLRAGGKLPTHSHPDYVAIALGGACRVKFASPEEEPQEVEFKPGETFWRKAESHGVENIGQRECHVLNIELK